MSMETVPKARQRERLTRERVVSAALSVMDREGLEAVSMRRVGRELGVEAMSLYNHVADKDDLLDGIVERVMSEFRVPRDTADWLEAGREAAREWRRLLQNHPQVIQVFAERSKPLRSATALMPTEFALTCLRNLGLSPEEAGEVFHAIGGYIFGFVLMETRQMFGAPDVEGITPEELRAAIPSDLPHVAECFPAMCSVQPDEQFEAGLDLFLLGLRAKVDAAAGR